METARLVEREPALAAAMGLDSSAAQGSLTPGRAGPADARPARSSRCWSRSPGPTGVAGCAAVVERLVLPPKVDAEIPEDPAGRRGVRPRAPRPAGGAHRRRCDARRGDVLCIATACPRRRPVRRRRKRPGASAAAAAGRDVGGRRVSELFDEEPRERGRTAAAAPAPVAGADHHGRACWWSGSSR